MPAVFEHIYGNGALLVLWGALLCHLLLPLPASAHPITLWRAFAHLLADKVNINSSYSQSLISGSLAWILMVLPAWILCIALKPLVWQPELFNLALLFVAIEWRNNEKSGHRLTDALAKEDKKRARELLQPLLNRETSSLSALGLGKAAAETLILGYGRQVVAVLFWYGVAGGVGAFMFRLISELARSWSPSRQHFSPFGIAAVRMASIFEFIPLRLFSLLVIVGNNARQIFSQMVEQSRNWPAPGVAWLLTSVGNKLELSLGGPVIYSGKKTIRPKIGGRIAPSALHISQIRTLLSGRLLMWVVIQSIVMLIIHKGV